MDRVYLQELIAKLNDISHKYGNLEIISNEINGNLDDVLYVDITENELVIGNIKLPILSSPPPKPKPFGF